MNGELVPGPLLSPPWAVEGGGGGVTTIDHFSNDSGSSSGDGVTNDNTLTLTGSAAANSAVKVFDGATQIGTTTANSSGAWTYTTAVLSDGSHSLKATATTPSGTSSTSSVLAVKIDTAAPTAPTMATPINNANGGLNLTGAAEANSVVKVFDGTTQIGTATANSSGVWSYTTGALAAGSHSLTAKATDAAGNTGAASAVLTASIGTSAPPVNPAAPTIASFSNDTGVAGDGITSDNTLQLKGTAAANSTVKIYDGSTQIGTTTASSTGSWDYITSVLSNAKHVLTATATTSSGQTSAASGAVSVTVDKVAPTAPVLSSNSIVNTNQVKLSGTAEANSTVTVYDGATAVGTGTTNSSGAWSITTSALSTGTHALTAKAADVAGNVSTASQSISSAISGASTPPSPGKQIESAGATSLVQSGDKYSLISDSGSGPTLKYAGAAFVSGQFGSWTPIGTEETGSGYIVAWKDTSSGRYTVWTTDSNGNYITNTADVAGTSATLAPVEVKFQQDLNGNGILGTTGTTGTTIDSFGLTSLVKVGSNYQLNSAGDDSGPTLKYAGTAFVSGQFGSWTPIGAEETGSGYSVAWKDTSSGRYTVWATDSNGNYITNIAEVAGTSATLASVETKFQQDLNGDGVISGSSSSPPLSSVGLTNLYKNWSDIVTIKGTADANSQIKLYDGNTSLGTVTTAADGTWSYKTSSAVSDSVHTYTARQIDGNGQVVGTSGSAILGSTGSNTLKSTSGDDILVGGGQADTFAFAANFGRDVIKDFVASGSAQDTIQFSKTVFDNFASVLSHASQVDQDVVISSGNDTLTLKNTKLSSLNSGDFHFA